MVTITLKEDNTCEMASVYDNLGNGMEGNFWDFHNGCHGLYQFKQFNSVSEFINILKEFHEANGEYVEIIKTTYKYI